MKLSAETPQSVSDLMTADLVAVLPEDRVGRARDLMISVGIHAIPVMEGNDVVGIVTSTDLIDDWSDDEPLTTILTPVPTSIHVDASLREAADVMISQRIHHLLVADDREVVGILSSFDLLDAVTST